MVRELVGLKARMFWNGLRSDRQRMIGLPLIVALVTWIGWRLAGANLATLRAIPADAAVEYLAWAATIAFVGWAALPVVVFPLDESLDPQQLATLPVPRPRLAAGLIAASFVAPPVIAALAIVGSTVAFRPGIVLFALPVAAVYLVMLAVGAQALSTVMSAVLHTRRGRDIAVFVIMGIGLGCFAGYQEIRGVVGDLGVSSAALSYPLAHLWWLVPPVAPARAITEAWAGDWAGATAALLVAVAWVGVIGMGWERTLRWLLITPRQESGQSPSRGRHGLARGRWSIPLMVARKELRFYLRDPRQRLVWTGTVIFVGLAVAAIVVGSEGFARFRTKEWLPVLAPALVLMVGLPIALNQFGWERNAASYLFVLPAKTRSVILGKNLAATVGLVAETSFIGLLFTWFSSGWRWAPLVLPLSLGAIACLLAVGNVISVLTPLRLPREGTDMFAQSTEQGLLALLSQFVSFFVIGLLLVLPASATVLTVSFGEVISPWITALLSIGWGAMWYLLSLWLSGWLLKRRVPEVVGSVQVA